MTFTKEQLIAQAEGNITMLRASLEHVKDPFERDDISTDLRLAEIALASLEAEPVMYASKETLAYAKDGEQLLRTLSSPSGDCVIPLYSAPPAPVSVPDDVTGPLEYAYKELTTVFMRNHISAFERYGIYPDGSAAIQAMRIALDGIERRAAMLQGAAGNSPAIPDGWVACSERMPDAEGNYWGWWSESKRQGPVWFIKSELQAQFQSSEITHWMPLPAAPQQEDIIC